MQGHGFATCRSLAAFFLQIEGKRNATAIKYGVQFASFFFRLFLDLLYSSFCNLKSLFVCVSVSQVLQL
jgi:hypothetical protein